MKKKLSLTFLMLLTQACVSYKPISVPNNNILLFEDVDKHVGEIVKIDAFVSRTHGAYGLYFKRSDFQKENEKCIRYKEISNYAHGQQVSFIGKIERTECGNDSICTNICDKYEFFVKND